MIHIYYKFNSFYSLCILRSPESVVIHELVFKAFYTNRSGAQAIGRGPHGHILKMYCIFKKFFSTLIYIYIYKTENEEATGRIFFHDFENLPLFLIACQDVLHEAAPTHFKKNVRC